MKRAISLLVAVALLCACAAGCNKNDGDKAFKNEVQTVKDTYADKTAGFQLEKPAAGETIAVMHTSMGDISIRFFPEAAPKAVENFLTHARNGYYNGLTFHRVIKDFMVQGGDPKGDGTGGQSIWGKGFEDEFDKKLLNLRGSLAMANSGVSTNGSQFFINQGDKDAFSGRNSFKYTDEELKEKIDGLTKQYNEMLKQYGKQMVESYYGSLNDVLNTYLPTYVYDAIPDAVWDLYEKNGGNIHLDGAWRRAGGHTVFGQVFEGMDIVDAIAAVEVDENDSTKVTFAVEYAAAVLADGAVVAAIRDTAEDTLNGVTPADAGLTSVDYKGTKREQGDAYDAWSPMPGGRWYQQADAYCKAAVGLTKDNIATLASAGVAGCTIYAGGYKAGIEAAVKAAK